MKADLGLTWIDVLKEVNAREEQAKAKADDNSTSWHDKTPSSSTPSMPR
jgi:hypothetical protein